MLTILYFIIVACTLGLVSLLLHDLVLHFKRVNAKISRERLDQIIANDRRI